MTLANKQKKPLTKIRRPQSPRRLTRPRPRPQRRVLPQALRRRARETAPRLREIRYRPAPAELHANESPVERPAPAPGSLSHLGIQVPSTGQVLEIRDRWSRARARHQRDEMHTECCFALQDKAWARDPDGNEWEAFTVLEDNLPEKAPSSISCCAPECCAPPK